MKIFITGGSGYIGNKLALKLADDGHTIHALLRKSENIFADHPRIRIFKGDITDYASIETAIKGCEQVYHVAAFAKLWARHRNDFFAVNVKGTQNVLQAAWENGVKKLVFTSSCAVFGPSLNEPIIEEDPRITAYSNDYDLSKFMAEAKVKEYAAKGLFSVIVNPSRVFGPGIDTSSNAITQMMQKCLQGKWVLVPGIKHVVGNYAFIDDVVNGHILAMHKGLSGERYILGGENISYSEFMRVVKDEIVNAHIVPMPSFAMRAWGFVELAKNKLTGSAPRFTPEAVQRYLQNASFNCSKAKMQLGYSITGFRTGIQQTVSFLKNNSCEKMYIP